MHEDPQPPPAQSGDPYIEQIMQREAEAAARQATRPPPPRRAPVALIVVLIVALAASLSWNVYVTVRQPQVFSADEQLAGAQFALYLAQQAITAYRDSTGRLPPSLAAAGLGGERITYALDGASYTLTAAGGDSIITYRSGQDVAPFARAYRALPRGGGR